MKSPTIGQIVFYVPLTDEPAQAFVAAENPIAGEAVIAPTPFPGGYRAATVVGLLEIEAARPHAALLVYKQPGDPYRGDADVLLQRLGEVPYSAHGKPGTWLFEKDARALENAANQLVAGDTLPS